MKTPPNLAVTLAVTMGDPAGVGPEIILQAVTTLLPRIRAGALRLLIIGHRSALAAARRVITDAPEIPVTAEAADWPALALLPAGIEEEPIGWGELSPEGGRFAYLAVEAASPLSTFFDIPAGQPP